MQFGSAFGIQSGFRLTSSRDLSGDVYGGSRVCSRGLRSVSGIPLGQEQQGRRCAILARATDSGRRSGYEFREYTFVRHCAFLSWQKGATKELRSSSPSTGKWTPLPGQSSLRGNVFQIGNALFGAAAQTIGCLSPRNPHQRCEQSRIGRPFSILCGDEFRRSIRQRPAPALTAADPVWQHLRGIPHRRRLSVVDTSIC